MPSTRYKLPDQGRPFTTACVGVTAPAAEGFSAKSLQPAAAAPAVMVTSCSKSRPFKGRLLICCASMTDPISEVVLCTRGTSALTCTCSETSPAERVKSTRVVCSTWTTSPSEMPVLKPLYCTVTEYLPGARLGTV